MSIMDVTISNNTIESYPAPSSGSPLRPLNLLANYYSLQPQGGTNYFFWNCYVGHNKIQPYTSCLNWNQFQLQYWTNDNNTDLNGQPLDTNYFPASGSYTTNWWPGHY
jgi:hypothetical protein